MSIRNFPTIKFGQTSITDTLITGRDTSNASGEAVPDFALLRHGGELRAQINDWLNVLVEKGWLKEMITGREFRYCVNSHPAPSKEVTL